MLILRKALDRIYLIGGIIGATSLLVILLLIVAQMIARWGGLTFPGSTAYAGYAMASASFFSLAYTLNKDAHIRVSLLLNRLGAKRFWLEAWCFGMGAFLSSYLCYYAWRSIYFSHALNDISQSQDATPLWIPQLAMGVGAVLLMVAFWDNLVSLCLRRSHNMKRDDS